MSAGVALLLALLGLAGSLLVARWLWTPLKVRVQRGTSMPFVPPPDEPLDRAIYETFEELGIESEMRASPTARSSTLESATECLPLEAVFPAAAGERTEYLPIDPEWSASEP